VTRAVARHLAHASAVPPVVEGAAAIRLAGVCRRLSAGASALAPRETPHGPLDRAAGASLLGGDPGHDGVDVHAASAPGGLSAAAATGGTTHVVLLWLIVNLQYTPMGIMDVQRTPALPARTRPMSSRRCFQLRTGFLSVWSRLRYESHRCAGSPEKPWTSSRPWPSASRLAGSSGFG
jgi:hypothetical protein